jgi:hypothetical protein
MNYSIGSIPDLTLAMHAIEAFGFWLKHVKPGWFA